MSESDQPPPWWTKALVAALAGLIFSLTMSAILSLGSAFRVPPLVAVERSGIDFGMLAYTAFTGRPNPSAGGSRYVFVDVDRDACEAFSEPPEACAGGRPIPAALTIGFAEAARSSGASVVVIDVRVPDDEVERRRLAAALAVPDGPWVIASLSVRPRASVQQMEVVADVNTLLGASSSAPVRSGRLLLAPFVTTTDAYAADGTIRHYPVLERIEGLGLEGLPRWLPSAPFLAASLAQPESADAVLCRYYGTQASPCPDFGAGKTSTVLRFGERTDLRNRIFYSLPSLAAADSSQRSTYRERYLGFYDRFEASALMEDGVFSWPPDLMKGAVVVFGTSAPEGHDWHVSPLGPMAGPEILLNATRAFTEFSPLAEPSVSASASERFASAWRSFATKVGAMATGTLIMLMGWFLIFWVGDCWTAVPLWVRKILCVTAFILVMVVTALIELITGISSLERNAQVSNATDLLTPMLALGLEGFAEAARSFAQAAEALVAWALARGLSLSKRFKRSAANDVV